MNIRSNSHYEYPELIEELIGDLYSGESVKSINIWCGVEIPYNFDNQFSLDFLQDGLKAIFDSAEGIDNNGDFSDAHHDAIRKSFGYDIFDDNTLEGLGVYFKDGEYIEK